MVPVAVACDGTGAAAGAGTGAGVGTGRDGDPRGVLPRAKNSRARLVEEEVT